MRGKENLNSVDSFTKEKSIGKSLEIILDYRKEREKRQN